jgi:hypothetical protein
MRITFVIDRFKGAPPEDVAAIAHDHDALWTMLDALVKLDVQYLKLHPETPLLYDAYRQGLVYYQEEPEGQEDWLDIPTMLKQHACDCEEIAAWRTAELKVRFGIEAEPWFIWKRLPNGGNLYHIQDRFPDGHGGWVIEDPCRKLGMK